MFLNPVSNLARGLMQLVAIIKCALQVCAWSHWFACIWILQAFIAAETPMPSWLGDDGYCSAVGDDGSAASLSHLNSNGTLAPAGYVCMPPSALYVASLYFAVFTITSIGYGDIAATPHNQFEQAVCTVLMLFSSLLWAQVIGTYCGIVATLNPEASAFHEQMDDINREIGPRLDRH